MDSDYARRSSVPMEPGTFRKRRAEAFNNFAGKHLERLAPLAENLDWPLREAAGEYGRRMELTNLSEPEIRRRFVDDIARMLCGMERGRTAGPDKRPNTDKDEPK